MTCLALAAACTAAPAEDDEEASVLYDGVVTTDGLSPDALPTTPSNGSPATPSNGSPTSVTILSDWGSGYCASVSVTNEGTTQVTSWTAVIDLKQSAVNSLWNAESSQSGSILTVRSPAGSAIPAGGSTSFGFCASAASSSDRPVVVSITQTGAGGAG